jgi:hypothetical protein
MAGAIPLTGREYDLVQQRVARGERGSIFRTAAAGETMNLELLLTSR